MTLISVTGRYRVKQPLKCSLSFDKHNYWWQWSCDQNYGNTLPTFLRIRFCKPFSVKDHVN